MISKIKYPVIVAGLMVLMAGCVTDPDFERHNQNDPGAEIFKPDAPKNQEREITAEKHVILRWEDNTEFEDGFLVEKKLLDDTDYAFVVIDTLSANMRSYTDASRELTASTVYRVTPFVFDDSGAISENSKNYTTIHLNLRELGRLNLRIVNDSVRIEWKNSLEYFDAITFGYIEMGNAESEVVWVDTVTLKDRPLPFSNNAKYIAKPTNAFQYEMVAAAHILDPENAYSTFSTSKMPMKLNRPVFEKRVFEDEETLLIGWSSIVPDVEAYQVYGGYGEMELVATLPGEVNTYRFKRTFRNSRFDYALQGVKNGFQSTMPTNSANPRTKKLENFNLTLHENSIQLTWDIPDNPNPPYTRFIIERSVGGKGNFEVYSELPPTAVEFTDNNLSESEIYYYRVKSASSDYSAVKGAGYVARLSLQRSIQRAADVTYQSISSDRQEIGAIEKLDLKRAYLTDLSGNERIISEPDFDLSRVNFSRDNRYIILTGDSAGVAYTNIYDRQTLERKFQIKRENLSEPVLLIPGTDRMIKIDFMGNSPSGEVSIFDLKIIDLHTGEVMVSNTGIEGDYRDNFPLKLFYDIQNDQFITTDRHDMTIWNADLSLYIKNDFDHFDLNKIFYDDVKNIMYVIYFNRIYQHDLNARGLIDMYFVHKEPRRFVYLRESHLFAYIGDWSSGVHLYNPSNGMRITEISGESDNIFAMYDWSENNQLIIQKLDGGTLFYDLVNAWSEIK